jgi:hypothetical protein
MSVVNHCHQPVPMEKKNSTPITSVGSTRSWYRCKSRIMLFNSHSTTSHSEFGTLLSQAPKSVCCGNGWLLFRSRGPQDRALLYGSKSPMPANSIWMFSIIGQVVRRWIALVACDAWPPYWMDTGSDGERFDVPGGQELLHTCYIASQCMHGMLCTKWRTKRKTDAM